MTKQTSYNLINRNSVVELANKYEFSNVIITDGYDKSFIYDFK